MKARERGGGLLIVALLLITAGAFAVVIAATQAGGDIRDTDAGADSVQALYLAETGIERALKRFATSASATPCASLAAETITNLTAIGLGASGHTIAILAGDTTDFLGATLPLSQCRVRVTGTVDASGVSRTLHAIVDSNLLEGPDNPSFDNPLTGTPPTGWTGQTPATAFAPNGGADGTAPNCRRSAWTAKQDPVGTRRATATGTVAATVTAGSTTTIRFHRRIITRAVDCGALPGAGVAPPAACGAAGDSTVCFQLTGAGGPWTVASNAATAGAGIAACPSTFSPCTTNYQAGAPGTKVTLTVAMAGATTVTSVVYHLQVQNLGRKELFVDYIEVTNPTFVGAAHVKRWRDCSGATTPSTCL